MEDAYFYTQHKPLNPCKLTVDLPDRSEGVVSLLTKELFSSLIFCRMFLSSGLQSLKRGR